MKNFLVILVLIITAHTDCFSQFTDALAEVSVPLLIYDNGGGMQTLEFGVDQTATDSLNTNLGEEDLPPLPPVGVFEARFHLPYNNFTGALSSYKDYRNATGYPFTGSHEHRIKYQVASGATFAVIKWDLPMAISGTLKDLFGGVIINKVMVGVDSLVMTNFVLDQLQMIIDYDAVTPVELSYFAAIVNGNKVTLNWRTESELNNYGFDIERKTFDGEWQTIGFLVGNGTTSSPSFYKFEDETNLNSQIYQYRLKQIDLNGSYSYSKMIEINIASLSTYVLNQNFPNPFNPSTTISFNLPVNEFITLSIYNSLGQKVDEIVNENLSAGIYNFEWNATQFSSGIYFYELKTENFISVKKMQLLK